VFSVVVCATGTEQTVAQQIVSETLAVLDSAAFQTNFDHVGENLFLAPQGHSVSPDSLRQAYLGGAERWPVTIEWTGADEDTDVDTTIKDGHATVVLGRGHLKRWTTQIVGLASGASIVNPSQPGRACVVNSVAHELSHTLRDAKGRQLVTDAGFHFLWWRRLASYTVGGIAECTYRAEHGGLAGQDVRSCIDAASVHPARCPVGP
jgi:hypothetical protein